LMVKSLSVMGITDSDFPMSSIIGRANLLLTTSIGGGVWMRIKNPGTHHAGVLFFLPYLVKNYFFTRPGNFISL
ncbi:hypothetical protein, partial [Citrobacter portucalensis]|uniref:hypothetical protein n=1 Tax=Citrobacter portucalensis TaxID=1639133 RepID=UPI00226B15DD